MIILCVSFFIVDLVLSDNNLKILINNYSPPLSVFLNIPKLFIIISSPSITRMKSKGDRGYPCRNPRQAMKKSTGIPLTRTT